MLQVRPDGSLLDIQLPSGSAHVVLISLLHMLRELKEQYSNMMVPQAVTKVVFSLGVQVRSVGNKSAHRSCFPGTCILLQVKAPSPLLAGVLD